MFNPWASNRRRLLKAAYVVVGNVVAWLVIPYYLGVYLSKVSPGAPLTILPFVYGFGLLITALQLGAALTDGRLPWVPFTSATYLVEAAYLWIATDGGELAVSTSGISISLSFRLLVLLLLLGPIWGIARAPLSYLVYRRSGYLKKQPAPA